MKGGVAHIDCKNFTVLGGCFTGEMECGIYNENSTNGYISGALIDLTPGVEKKHASKKVGRNQTCPCGSGVKYKRCHGGKVSTGIKSNNSTFTVGKATIIADTGIDLQNNSRAHIEELIHYSPDVAMSLKALPVQPPEDLVQDAIAEQKALGTIENSKLKAWFDGQGINASFWINLTVAIAALF